MMFLENKEILLERTTLLKEKKKHTHTHTKPTHTGARSPQQAAESLTSAPAEPTRRTPPFKKKTNKE